MGYGVSYSDLQDPDICLRVKQQCEAILSTINEEEPREWDWQERLWSDVVRLREFLRPTPHSDL